ncbi:MAG: hypothetical protein IKB34_06290 [Clostridia bacterium]|nr:hypothetical protein [Clostridia bacterium]
MNRVGEDLIKVTDYKVLGRLPELFKFDDGNPVVTPGDWEKRRGEIYKTAIELQYGTMPPAPDFVEVENVGDQLCRSYRIHTGTRDNPISFYMKLIIPEKRNGPCPVIVDGDMCFNYFWSDGFLNAALEQGVAWVLFDRTEIAHDVRAEGRRVGQIYNTYPGYTFGALGAWAWGYSRCVDALEILFGGRENPEIDLSLITFTGHSRGGKTAALAGALDKRAAIVNPNQSGECGCGCYRILMQGYCEGVNSHTRSEVLRDDVTLFPYWTGPELASYVDREQDLPFDSHFLKALIAPRVLYTSDAAADIWANPIGAWMTNMAAKDVWGLLGKPDNLIWRYREGVHSHTAEDIQMLVNVIKHYKDPNVPLDECFFATPFKPREFIF